MLKAAVLQLELQHAVENVAILDEASIGECIDSKRGKGYDYLCRALRIGCAVALEDAVGELHG